MTVLHTIFRVRTSFLQKAFFFLCFPFFLVEKSDYTRLKPTSQSLSLVYFPCLVLRFTYAQIMLSLEGVAFLGGSIG